MIKVGLKHLTSVHNWLTTRGSVQEADIGSKIKANYTTLLALRKNLKSN